MRIHRSLLLALVATSLLAACGGGDDATAPPTTGGPPTGVPPVGQQAAPVLDVARAVSDSIPLEGGTIVATGTDGTTYRLTIPATALLHPVRITVTPVTGVNGFAANGGRWVGVDLKPHGLRFESPLTLSIVPPGGNAAVNAAGFAYAKDGEDFHRYPVMPDPTKLEVKILHFSGITVYVGDGISIPVFPGDPVDVEASYEQAMATLIYYERQAFLENRPGDPRFVEKMEAIIGGYYKDIVQPILTRMVDDCPFAERNANKALGWARTAELMLAGSFDAEKGAVMDAMIEASRHCFDEAIKPCIDWGNPEQVKRAIAYERQLKLLGVEDARSVTDPALACADLEGTITTSYTEAGMTQTVTATVRFELDKGSTGPGGRSYRVKSGQVTWNGELAVAGCQATVASVSAPINADDGILAIMLQPNNSQVYFGTAISLLPNSTVVVKCGDEPPQSAPWPVGAQKWLYIPYPPGAILEPGSRALQGSFNDGTRTWRWQLQMGGGTP
jgi:hypothetical protein